MKVKVKSIKKEESFRKISISTEYIKLDSFLKFAAIVQTGGEAKMLIEDGIIKVNGESCTQRGKKLRVSDVITVDGEAYVIVDGNE